MTRPPARSAWATAFATGLLAALAYFFTAAPGPYWGDGMELSAAAAVLGVPHPTGYPLYMTLGHAAIRLLGFVEPARAMTLFSLALCAVSVILATRVFLAHLTNSVWAGDGNPADAPERRPTIRLALVAAGAGLIFAFSRAVWDHATFPEVYPLTLAFAMAILTLAAAPPPGSVASAWRWLALMAALWGLASLNHYSVILLAPLTVLTLIDWARRVDPARPFRRAAAFITAHTAMAAVFLSGYAYIPLRARANPAINWGDARTFDRLLWMVRGGEYINRYTGESQAGATRKGLTTWVTYWARQIMDFSGGPTVDSPPPPEWLGPLIGVPVLLGAVVGLALVCRRRPFYISGLIAVIALTGIIAATYHIPDIDGYFMAAIPVVIIGWIELIRVALRRFAPGPAEPGELGLGPRLARISSLLPLALAGVVFFSLLPITNKSWDEGPRRWADNLFNALPENAMLLTRNGSDAEIFTLWYEQYARGRRPDVVVFGCGFMFQGWYANQFGSRHPDVPAFIVQRPPGAKQVFDVALIAGVIMPNYQRRPIFTTDFRDQTLREQMKVTHVADLLPREYYYATAYRINLPSPKLFKLEPDPADAPIFTGAFMEIFGHLPPQPLP